ncbi:MAG: alcohol dehydrogenase catalytic domain-containing protein [Clostridiaceae bacterium]|nr:alcohol dehydrogenase catalytic domain-containing protein [Clostridiaceae bacterium]
MQKAKAAVYVGHNKPFELREYPVVEPPRGYARLKLIASGVCGTDVHIHDGTLGGDGEQIIGHEFVGTVDAISPEDAAASGLSLGDAVIACIASPCGGCALCNAGDWANCVHMGVTNAASPAVPPYFHGGYAEYNFNPVANLIKIPATVDPYAAAVFACAGPTALHAFKLTTRANIDVAAAHVAVVQGLGPVGMFSVMRLAALGVPHIAAVTGRTVPARAALAAEFGATVCYGLDNTSADDLAGIFAAQNDGLGADLCIEASGNPSAFAQGLTYLRNRGAYLVPGQYSVSGGVPVSPEVITFKALQIFGSSQYDLDDIRAYLDFLEKNPTCCEKMRKIVSAYPVERVNDAFQDIRKGFNIKTLLV